MKIQQVNENTIKVTLTKNDFNVRDIDISKIKPGTSLYRQLVVEIMAKASRTLNFNATDCKVVVEGQVTNTDEITLLITKLGTEPNILCPDCIEKSTDSIADTIMDRLSSLINSFAETSMPMPQSIDALGEQKMTATPGFPADVIIAFSDFEKLIALLHNAPYAKSIASSLYSHNNSYFLVLKVYARNANTALKFRNFAMEYDGIQVPTDVFTPILREHGTLVIKKGAIPFLTKKFSM